ncbi:hypothetical protein Q8A73_006405 [Channa argus]|nr:hypothetical protein Q8A73_006405 [Channa argus]
MRLYAPINKPRVYLGVRVKTTVKELLQRQRAREANSKKVKTDGSDLPDVCASISPSRYVDPPSGFPLGEANNGGARALQLRTASFSVPEGSCTMHMQVETLNEMQQQFVDTMSCSNGYSGNNNSSNSISNNSDGSGYNASLPPHPILPLPWCHGLSLDAEYYGHEMAPCSPPESLKLCSPMDHNSCSPQDSFSSSSSSCYDSPTRVDSSYHGFASEHYQHCNVQDCYCLPHCWSGQQESFPAPEYAPYYNPTDYPYTYPVEEDCFKRDLQMSSEMCYNVLW